MQSLAQIAFFKGVADLDPARFERRCVWKKIDEGQAVVGFDDATSDVYFLVSGDVRIEVRTAGGKELILADLSEGDLFGDLSAIDGEPRSASVTALTNVVICIVGAALFREMLAASPTLSGKMMQRLSRRIRELNVRLLEHTALDIRHNLYAELLRLSAPRAQSAPARVVSPPPYHHVLAARLGCRREQVTRELIAMERDGLLVKTRGALILPDPEAIRSRISQKMQAAG